VELTGGQAMARQLALEGVEVVFGLPGVQLDYAVDGLASKAPEIRFIATRHEQATTYMADGYSRASGKPGVAMVVPGPGVLNSLAGIATAWASGSRVLLIAAQIPSPLIGQTRGVLHEIPDQTAVLRTLTKWTGLASRPEDVPGVVREGFAQLTSGRPRPVAVELPPDVLAGEGQVELATPVAAPPLPEPDGTLVERAARLLAEARFPVIHVGGGVISSGAAPAVVELAERLQAPILKSSFGHSAIDDRHPLVVPTQQSAAILGRADVVLVVGSRFLTRSGGTMPVREGARLVGLNLDRHDLGPPRAFDLDRGRARGRVGAAGGAPLVVGAGWCRGRAATRGRRRCPSRRAGRPGSAGTADELGQGPARRPSRRRCRPQRPDPGRVRCRARL
jgi:acetolactate synthase-1/2/3 large subunit